LSSAEWHASSLFPPQHKNAFHKAVLEEILEERVCCSRNRVNERGVKRKMSNYNLRKRHRGRTQRVNYYRNLRIIK
jgi:hypothetical protein